jgi:5-oxopent-3-ene-1,2,5-tricarboxylate decarboxylase/2-hydroxyhepta-2,4-diene-1,7-dioate isomerase
MRHARVAVEGAIHRATVGIDLVTLTLEDGRQVNESSVVWLPPVEPGTIFALGLNYADHAAELAFKAPEKPLIFLKGPNALIGHRGVSNCPPEIHQMHFECELAVVIGRGGRRIKRSQAYDHVAGYTIANDYAFREYLENYYRPNLRVKNRDHCTPLGPFMVDAADIPDPMALALESRVNGEIVQQGTTRDMIFDIPTLIEYLSEFMTLAPGDLILTGTPEGVRYLGPGDEVVTAIERIGSLTNTVIRDAAPEREENRHDRSSD